MRIPVFPCLAIHSGNVCSLSKTWIDYEKDEVLWRSHLTQNKEGKFGEEMIFTQVCIEFKNSGLYVYDYDVNDKVWT